MGGGHRSAKRQTDRLLGREVRIVAEIEGRRIAEGKPPVWGPWAGQDLGEQVGSPVLAPIKQVGH
jgi:hypothetical protein